MWYEWFFDGIGTWIISLIIGLIIGGTATFSIKSHNKQKQTAGNNSIQTQIGNITVVNNDKEKHSGD